MKITRNITKQSTVFTQFVIVNIRKCPMDYLVWVFFALFYNGLCYADDLPCNAQSAKYGFICVCNSSYCDTIERPTMLPRGQFHHYATSSISPGFTHTVGHFSAFSSDAEYYFTVNSSMLRQEVFGIGGSFTDTVGALYNNLSEATQDKFMESYFGVSGIEYTMARLPIGASDFSPRPYTYDDVPFDFDLSSFALQSEDYTLKIPLVKKAKSVSDRGVKLIGCTWYAPGWMMVENNTTSFMRQNCSSVWAKYHVKFLDSYKKEGLDFWGLSGGNELALSLMLPGVMPILSTAMQQRDWFKDQLKPQLVAANYSDVKLIAMEDQRLFALYWMERFADDPQAYDALDAIGLHWYFDQFIPPKVLDLLHEKYPEKQMLYTETSVNIGFGPDKVQLGQWSRAEAYGHSILECLNHWSQSYLDWNLILNLEGGPTRGLNTDAAVIVNTTSGELYKQPLFYALGHFSKFILPGSRVVQVTSRQSETNETHSVSALPLDKLKQTLLHKQTKKFIPYSVPSTVQCTATANSDGSYSIILMNSKNTTARVGIEDPLVGTITWPMGPHSIDTFVYWY